jgi:hypothetical protein
MIEGEKKILEGILGREISPVEEKIYDILNECGKSDGAVLPMAYTIDFGLRCYEMGKNEKNL